MFCFVALWCLLFCLCLVSLCIMFVLSLPCFFFRGVCFIYLYLVCCSQLLFFSFCCCSFRIAYFCVFLFLYSILSFLSFSCTFFVFLSHLFPVTFSFCLHLDSFSLSSYTFLSFSFIFAVCHMLFLFRWLSFPCIQLCFQLLPFLLFIPFRSYIISLWLYNHYIISRASFLFLFRLSFLLFSHPHPPHTHTGRCTYLGNMITWVTVTISINRFEGTDTRDLFYHQCLPGLRHDP